VPDPTRIPSPPARLVTLAAVWTLPSASRFRLIRIYVEVGPALTAAHSNVVHRPSCTRCRLIRHRSSCVPVQPATSRVGDRIGRIPASQFLVAERGGHCSIAARIRSATVPLGARPTHEEVAQLAVRRRRPPLGAASTISASASVSGWQNTRSPTIGPSADAWAECLSKGPAVAVIGRVGYRSGRRTASNARSTTSWVASRSVAATPPTTPSSG